MKRFIFAAAALGALAMLQSPAHAQYSGAYQGPYQGPSNQGPYNQGPAHPPYNPAPYDQDRYEQHAMGCTRN